MGLLVEVVMMSAVVRGLDGHDNRDVLVMEEG